MTAVERRLSNDLPVTIEEPKSFIVKLIMGKLPTFNQLFNLKMLKSIFWSPDPDWLKEGRDEIQSIFKRIVKSKPPLNLHLYAFTNRLLTIYPYLDPEEGERIVIPGVTSIGQLQENTYIVQKIEVTSIPFTSPIVAYGLTPVKEGVDPILVFKGTTFPADSGFILSLMADTAPLHSVGSLIIEHPSKALIAWLGGKKNVHAVGQSLGGALAQHAARLFPDQIEFVTAINAPRFMSYDKTEKMKGYVIRYENKGDLISKVGNKIPSGESRIIQSVKPYSLFLSHIRAIEVDEGSSIEVVNDESALKGKVSFFMTLLHQVMAPILFIMLALVVAVLMVARAIIALSFVLVSTFKSSH